MHAKTQLYAWMAVLVAIGLGIAAHKVIVLDFPLVPGEQQTVWTVEARLRFDADGGPVKASLNLPRDTASLVVIDSGAASPGYGFQRADADSASIGTWSARNRRGPQTLYYRAKVYRGNGNPPEILLKKPAKPEKPLFREPRATAAESLLADAFFRSADGETMAVRLVELLQSKAPNENRVALLQEVKTDDELNALILDLLHTAGVPARLLRGVELTGDARRSKLQSLIEVWNEGQWVAVNPVTAEVGMSETFLPWQRAGQWLFEVEGGRKSRVGFSVISDELAARNVALNLGRARHADMIDFSILGLPVDVQNTFEVLLLIPIGALVVVILRNLVGIRTSGTFMPILIAIAFVQTTLLTGLILFLTVVGIGLLIRGYLSRLNLLLVPRIAAVLIVVIALYVGMTITGFKMGLTAVLSVTFFPMIIIAWTIERMSVLWEEEGGKEVMIQGGGSLLTAVLAYLLMTQRHVEYLFFAFPELLLVVLAIILAIGQYTGYRLSEFRRFEPLAREH